MKVGSVKDSASSVLTLRNSYGYYASSTKSFQIFKFLYHLSPLDAIIGQDCKDKTGLKYKRKNVYIY